MRDTYGYKGKIRVVGGKFEDLDNEQADLALVFSTDPQLALKDKYVAFVDDKQFFPPYNISLGVRNETLQKLGPKTQQAIERVQEGLTEEAMRELNRRADLEKQEPEEVAAAYSRSPASSSSRPVTGRGGAVAARPAAPHAPHVPSAPCDGHARAGRALALAACGDVASDAVAGRRPLRPRVRGRSGATRPTPARA
jgi:hypothetical protein